MPPVVQSLLAWSLLATPIVSDPRYLIPRYDEPDTKQDVGSTPSSSPYLTQRSKEFAVNGSSIPLVDFDIGESYAGMLPIDDEPNDPNRLFFWFFPSKNPSATDEITVWLNGGPGCSSMIGLIQEHGPFLWQPGTYRPIRNPYSWSNLTNIVYIDQPIGTGFSTVAESVAEQERNEYHFVVDFLGFWKNFIDTFDLHHRKLYLTGESYAGHFIPYIADAMLDDGDSRYFNISGVMLNNPSINHPDTMIHAPATQHLISYSNILPLNDSFLAHISSQAEVCGYTSFMRTALTFPPTGPLPPAPPSSASPSNSPSSSSNCQLWSSILKALLHANPCFNPYHLTDSCPVPWNIMDFPGMSLGPHDYFSREDVQHAIHAPRIPDFHECIRHPRRRRDEALSSPSLPPSSLGPLPLVIERVNNVVIGTGKLDFLLFADGTLASVQNMTWNGVQGFGRYPDEELFVPYHSVLREVVEGMMRHQVLGGGSSTMATGVAAGAGVQGRWRRERGLTVLVVELAGHQIPQHTPGVAYRELEYLLGRIGSLSERGSFTTQTGDFAIGEEGGEGHKDMDPERYLKSWWCGEEYRF